LRDMFLKCELNRHTCVNCELNGQTMEALREANREIGFLLKRVEDVSKENSQPEDRRDLIMNLNWERMADRFLILEKEAESENITTTTTNTTVSAVANDESLKREILSLMRWRELERRKKEQMESLREFQKKMMEYSQIFLSTKSTKQGPVESLIRMEREDHLAIAPEVFQQITRSLSKNHLAFLLFQTKIKTIRSGQDSLLLIQPPDNYYIFLRKLSL
jgi:hypothetical protein